MRTLLLTSWYHEACNLYRAAKAVGREARIEYLGVEEYAVMVEVE